MTHVHEWIPGGGYDDCFWWCSCGKEMEGDDITRRLNATERLGAQDARVLGAQIGAMQEWAGNTRLIQVKDSAFAYAAALEDSPTT